jgi:hypothetical protein
MATVCCNNCYIAGGSAEPVRFLARGHYRDGPKQSDPLLTLEAPPIDGASVS